jgi:hypothetical protein
MVDRPKGVSRGDAKGPEDSRRDDHIIFQEATPKATHGKVDPASIAARIPELTESASVQHDKLSIAEFTTLGAEGKKEYKHREIRTALEVQITHFRTRCDYYEAEHDYLIQRVAELEQSERLTKAGFDFASISLSVGGSVISFASLFLWDSVKWLFAGVGAGMCVIGVGLLRNISRHGWPPFRKNPNVLGQERNENRERNDAS